MEKYLGIRLWSRMMGSLEPFIDKQVEIATKENAPEDAIFLQPSGCWKRVKDLPSDHEFRDVYEEGKKDVWWKENWERAIDFVADQDSRSVAELACEIGDEENIEAFMDCTAKHQALGLLYSQAVGIDGFEELLDEWELDKFQNDESLIDYMADTFMDSKKSDVVEMLMEYLVQDVKILRKFAAEKKEIEDDQS